MTNGNDFLSDYLIVACRISIDRRGQQRWLNSENSLACITYVKASAKKAERLNIKGTVRNARGTSPGQK